MCGSNPFWEILVRRGGKSRAIAALIVFIATLVDHSKAIVPGERPVVLCLAPTARQARVSRVRRRHHRDDTDVAPLIVNKTTETIELGNGITIEVRPATLSGTSGYSTVAVVADEIAFRKRRKGQSRQRDPSGTAAAWARRAGCSDASRRRIQNEANSTPRTGSTPARTATRDLVVRRRAGR